MSKVKKCWHHLQQAEIISFFVTRKCQKNPENQWKSMKIATVNREIIHNFWTTWGVSIKFSWKMWIMIILKVTKKQGLTLSLEDTFFAKRQGGSNSLPPPPPAILGLNKLKLGLWSIKVFDCQRLINHFVNTAFIYTCLHKQV